jgi:hypothetical protein
MQQGSLLASFKNNRFVPVGYRNIAPFNPVNIEVAIAASTLGYPNLGRSKPVTLVDRRGKGLHLDYVQNFVSHPRNKEPPSSPSTFVRYSPAPASRIPNRFMSASERSSLARWFFSRCGTGFCCWRGASEAARLADWPWAPSPFSPDGR